MQLVKRNNFALAGYGLNGRGWWGRNFRKLVKAIYDVAKYVPVYGPVVRQTLEQIGAIDPATGQVDFRSTQAAFEPSAAEAAVLESWVNKLKPFYKTMAEQLASVYSSNDVNAQINIINEVMLKIGVIKAYYARFELNGLGTQAQAMRLDIIDEIMKPAETLIEQTFAQNGIMAKKQSQTIKLSDHLSKFSGLITANGTASFSVPRYVVMSSDVVPTPTTPMQPTGGTTPVVTTTTTNQSTTSTALPTNKKTIGFVLLGAAVLTVLLWPSDKSKS